MITRCIVTAFMCAVFLSATLAGADLTKVDRSIKKEPAYQTKSPKYCLLVFGPEAKTRVWLVLDGDTLYIAMEWVAGAPLFEIFRVGKERRDQLAPRRQQPHHHRRRRGPHVPRGGLVGRGCRGGVRHR